MTAQGEEGKVEVAFHVSTTGRTAYFDLNPEHLPRIGETVVLDNLPSAVNREFTITDVHRRYDYRKGELTFVAVELKEKER